MNEMAKHAKVWRDVESEYENMHKCAVLMKHEQFMRECGNIIVMAGRVALAYEKAAEAEGDND